jgi:hypothetical protein
MFQMNKILLFPFFLIDTGTKAPKPDTSNRRISLKSSSLKGSGKEQEKKPNAENHSQLTSVIT